MADNYLICPAQKRTINVINKSYFVPFPKMLFWLKNSKLHCAFLDYDEKTIYYPTLGNIFYDFSVCQDFIESDDIREHIKKFWQTSFNDSYSGFSSLNKYFSYSYTSSLILWENHNIDLEKLKTKAKFDFDKLEIYDLETKDHEFAYLYCTHISNKRWLEVEHVIKSGVIYWYDYCHKFRIPGYE